MNANTSRHRYRIRFAKQGDLRLLGHRDLLRAWERLFRRAALPLSMTEGFHPKPRVNFPSALAVGIAGLDEVVELELSAPLPAEQLREALPRHCPPGLDIVQIDAIPEGTSKAHVRRVTLEVGVPAELREGLPERIAAFLAVESYSVSREQRDAPLDIRPWIHTLEFANNVLRMGLWVQPEGSARPREVLDALGLGDVEEHGAYLTRTVVELH